jgi:antitoxin MazE
VASVRTNIVRIGNSRGIRLPKAVIEQCGLRDAVDLDVRDGQLLVRPAEQPRLGWEEAFSRMAERGDDELLDRESLGPTEWDAAEWEW